MGRGEPWRWWRSRGFGLLVGLIRFMRLAWAAIEAEAGLSGLIAKNVGDESIDYDAVYRGKSDWKLMVPVDHPDGVGGTLVSGTGLTHFGSARDRQAMHVKGSAETEENLTDSMKMFRWGVEGGRPGEGEIGIAPEWFYKGNGGILRGHGEAGGAELWGGWGRGGGDCGGVFGWGGWSAAAGGDDERE